MAENDQLRAAVDRVSSLIAGGDATLSFGDHSTRRINADLRLILAAATPTPPRDARVLKPRLTDAMIRSAGEAHYGKKAFRQLGPDGVDLTADGTNWTFRQGFTRMWHGAWRAAISKAPEVPAPATVEQEARELEPSMALSVLDDIARKSGWGDARMRFDGKDIDLITEAMLAYGNERVCADRVAAALSRQPAADGDAEAIRRSIINTPETADFMAAVPIEATHQRERWGSDHDAGKSPFDWFWLVGYLAQKAADAAVRDDAEKAKHHTISTAAALANWHAALTGADNRMVPGAPIPPGEPHAD